jgi:hypothetical protein
MSLYPVSIDNYSSLPVLFDRVSPVLAADVNRLRQALLAIQNELGTEPKGAYASVKARLDALQAAIELGTVAATDVSISDADGYYTSENVEDALQELASTIVSMLTDFITGMVELAEDKQYPVLINAPFAGTIQTISTRCSSGTVDLRVYIDGGLLDSASSVTTSLDTVVPTTNNVFVDGSDITLELLNNADAEDVQFTITYTRNF